MNDKYILTVMNLHNIGEIASLLYRNDKMTKRRQKEGKKKLKGNNHFVML